MLDPKQPRVQVCPSDLQGFLAVDHKKWTKMASVVKGVSEETTTGVHRLKVRMG